MNKEGDKDDEVFTKPAREIVASCAKKIENCERAFHALLIVGPPPPSEVAEKGEN
ncbi:hypothetical protein HAX54_015392 [Datura stramonium]|uniref:Uncharacterized protein n=1 Tax=Datura stramonium TaxID=4076 RepID=A0ABS8TRP7_DATST|nr:hypothetical protein [Datura stramonium]